MDIKHDLLELATKERPLSFSVAFDSMDNPVPAIFLTCRALVEDGALTRVGPGNFELTDQGRAELEDAGFEWTVQPAQGTDADHPESSAMDPSDGGFEWLAADHPRSDIDTETPRSVDANE